MPSKGSHPKTYKVRLASGKTYVLSPEKIVSRIKAGKLKGHEEISSEAEPHKWRKLSSVPEFYDALMARLYDSRVDIVVEAKPVEKEKLPEIEKQTEQKASPQKGATAVGKAEFTQRTQAVSPASGSDPEEELAPDPMEDLSDLFKESSPAHQPASRREKTSEIIMNDDSAEHPSLDWSAPDRSPADPHPVNTIYDRPRGSRRKIWLGALVALTLLYLLPGDPEKTETNIAPLASDSRPISQAEILSPEATEASVNARLNEGDIAYGSDVSRAILFSLHRYRDALRYQETNAIVLGRVAQSAARLYAISGKIQDYKIEAQSAIRNGRASDPHLSDFYRAEAMLAMADGQLEDAKAVINRAVDTDRSSPENALVLGELGVLYGDLARAKEALIIATKGRRTHARADFALAQVSLKLKHFEESKKYAFQVLSTSPFHFEAGLLLAQITEERGNLAEAKRLYKSVGKYGLFAKPGSAETLFGRLRDLQASSNESVAATLSQELFEFFKGQKSLESTFVQFQELQNAGAESSSGVGTFLYGRQQLTHHAERLSQDKRYNDSVSHYEAALWLDPSDGNSWVALGKELEKNATKYEEHLRVAGLFEAAIEADARLYHAFIELGLLETDQYNLDRALGLLKKAESLAPDNFAPYVALGKHFYRRNDYNTAFDYFRKAQELSPNNSEVHYYAGLLRVMAKKNVAQEALGLFERAFQIDPFNYDALKEWVKLKVETYQKNVAVNFINNLITQNPDNAYYPWILGEIYSANREHQRAVDVFERALKIDSTRAQFHMSVGASQEALGQMALAMTHYLKASDLDGRNLDGYFKATELAMELKDFERAKVQLGKLLQRAPKYPGAHRFLARVLLSEKKTKEALKEMQVEVANNPMNLKFRVELAELFQQFEQYDNAIGQLQEVVALSEGNTRAVLYTKARAYIILSSCYRSMKNFSAAEGAIKLAAAIDEELPEVLREMGYVYQGLQRDREAVAAFSGYLSRQPTAADASSIQQAIDRLSNQ